MSRHTENVHIAQAQVKGYLPLPPASLICLVMLELRYRTAQARMSACLLGTVVLGMSFKTLLLVKRRRMAVLDENTLSQGQNRQGKAFFFQNVVFCLLTFNVEKSGIVTASALNRLNSQHSQLQCQEFQEVTQRPGVAALGQGHRDKKGTTRISAALWLMITLFLLGMPG